jgi:hypothetical protein
MSQKTCGFVLGKYREKVRGKIVKMYAYCNIIFGVIYFVYKRTYIVRTSSIQV